MVVLSGGKFGDWYPIWWDVTEMCLDEGPLKLSFTLLFCYLLSLLFLLPENPCENFLCCTGTIEGKLMISKVIKEGSCFCRACNSELATNLKMELTNSNFQAYVLHYMFFWSQNYCENQTFPNPCNTYFCYWKHTLWDSKSYVFLHCYANNTIPQVVND